MLSQDEVKFLAILVQKGHVQKPAAEKVLQASTGGGSLAELLVRLGLLERERVDFLRRTGGEDVPAIPGYEYVAYAGFGGTALVFEGREKSSGRAVALKIMHRELQQDALQRRRFVHEAKLLMQLEQRSIVKGYRVGHVRARDGQERLVFIMEWVPAKTLLQLLREGKQFQEDLALYIILQTAEALQYLHGKGILHRDVKPDNILLTAENAAKLIDLGFATMQSEAGAGADDTTVGTAAYMSPEQAKGTADLDARADIYSLGATLYQIVVGELPFAGEGTQEQLAARILAALSSAELQSRRISPHMNYFIRKMMEQDRDFRYGDMAELVKDIGEQVRGKKTLSFDVDKGAEGGPLDRAPDEPQRGGDGPEPPPPKFPTRRRRR
ncbi:MAG: serine/threonine protein kinase [Planctomycetes bacterium]|nr:serine/threonine protein kinase [Planctomycetota bacterium]